MSYRWLTAFPVACALLPACATKAAPPVLTSTPTCLRAREPASASVRWIRTAEGGERRALDAWCAAVGEPAIRRPGSLAAPTLDSVAVVVWNTHVGGASVRRFVRDLRAGALTGGRPVEHFVLLLQEAHRAGRDVPAAPPTWAEWAGRIHASPADEDRLDVEALAEAEDLALLYVPSMRNGSPWKEGPWEDRGNAILSTLPLAGHTAVELPYERQRRVAVAARLDGVTTAGAPWSLRVVSAHLDNRARLGRIYRSFGAAQANQARGLLAALAEDVGAAAGTVVGGDLNTWYAGRGAGAVELLQARFASVREHPEGGTQDLPLFLPSLRLDHVFFGLPEGWDARYRVVDDTYGSDHRPLVGWVRTGGSAEPPRPRAPAAAGGGVRASAGSP